jgi:DNA-binding IclR family transcriptional regulator
MLHNVKPAPAYAGTQAVQRALRLLQAFSGGAAELRLGELANDAGLNKTTAFRLLSALENAEMVERTEAGDAYRLGPEIVRLGSLALGGNRLQAAAGPIVRALAEETRETVTLEVLVGSEAAILDEAMGSHAVGLVPSVGTRWAAHATSTGKVLLAHLPEDALGARLPRRLARFTPRTIVDRAALKKELRLVRERGVATCVEELEPGLVTIGAPVRSAAGVVAALSVGGPRSRLGPTAIAMLAKRLPLAADAVSERLGAPRRRS